VFILFNGLVELIMNLFSPGLLFAGRLYFCFNFIARVNLFRLFISSRFNFGRLYMYLEIFPFLLDFPIYFKIFPNNPLDFSDIYCDALFVSSFMN
jgi:hypothetical protein